MVSNVESNPNPSLPLEKTKSSQIFSKPNNIPIKPVLKKEPSIGKQ